MPLLISIILPLAKNENLAKIKRCLESLADPKIKDFELIIITFPGFIRKHKTFFRNYSFIRLYAKRLNKSAARNFGAKKAKGKYLLHLDADMLVSEKLFQELKNGAKKNIPALLIPFKISSKGNFWSQCRALEYRLISNSFLETPIFIKKTIFKQVKGYEEKLDPLDDWTLNRKLASTNIKIKRNRNFLIVRISPSLKQMRLRMKQRAKIMPLFKQYYPNSPHYRLTEKLTLCLKKWPLFFQQPILVLGLIFLKINDLTILSINRRKPTEIYQLDKTAQKYDLKRLGSNFNRYKHYCECRALAKILSKSPVKSILELGCGTGRITSILIKKGCQITAADNSLAMLEKYRQKTGLPKPVLLKSSKLPFPKDKFSISLAIRLIWHLKPKKQKKTILEMTRTARKYVIFDISNKKRLFRKLICAYNTYPVELKQTLAFCQQNKLKTAEIIPLDVSLPFWLNLMPKKTAEKLFPLLYNFDLWLAKFISPGRYLLKFEKKSE